MAFSIVIHAGANKTGSSAIQSFLALNHDRLREHGVLVPNDQFAESPRVSGHHVFAFQRLLDSPAEGRAQLESAIDALATIEGVHTVLLSAENLAANPGSPSLFEGLAKRYDVRLIMYIRRQDNYLLSTWRQWYFKIRKDFWAWLISEVGTTGDWRSYLERWDGVVSPENTSVRVYQRQGLVAGDVLDDFHSLLHLNAPMDAFERPEGRVNPSLSDAIIELVTANPLVFANVHDNEFQKFVISLTGDRYLASDDQAPLTLQQRRAILRRYEASNDWVLKRYFPDATEPLFTPPTAGPAASPDDRLGVQLEFLTTMLYQMYRRQSQRDAEESAQPQASANGANSPDRVGKAPNAAVDGPVSTRQSVRRWGRLGRSD